MRRFACALATLGSLAALPAAAGVPCYALASGEHQCVGRIGDPRAALFVTIDKTAAQTSASVEGADGNGKLLSCSVDAPEVVQTLARALDKRATVVVRFDKSGKKCLGAREVAERELAKN